MSPRRNKTMALEAKTLVVKSPQAPPVCFADFDHFADRIDCLIKDFYVADAGRLITECEECGMELERFGYCDEDGKEHKRLAKRISMMVGAFPNAAPPAPEVYLKMLTEHVAATHPDALVLESTCREIERTLKFVPSIAEVLAVLEKQRKLWGRRLDVIMYGPDALARRRATA